RGIVDGDGLAGNDVGAKRAADAAVDVERAAEHARNEIKAGSHGEAAAPLPFAEDMREHGLVRKRAILTKRQIVNPIAGEFVRLVETGNPWVGENIKSILSDAYPPPADG